MMRLDELMRVSPMPAWGCIQQQAECRIGVLPKQQRTLAGALTSLRTEWVQSVIDEA